MFISTLTAVNVAVNTYERFMFIKQVLNLLLTFSIRCSGYRGRQYSTHRNSRCSGSNGGHDTLFVAHDPSINAAARQSN